MINIDILLLLGNKGGFENALDRTATYLARHNCNVRFVQIIETGERWYSEYVSFNSLGLERSFTLDQCKARYNALLTKDSALPELVIVAGIPELIYVAKGVMQDLAQTLGTGVAGDVGQIG